MVLGEIGDIIVILSSAAGLAVTTVTAIFFIYKHYEKKSLEANKALSLEVKGVVKSQDVKIANVESNLRKDIEIVGTKVDAITKMTTDNSTEIKEAAKLVTNTIINQTQVQSSQESRINSLETKFNFITDMLINNNNKQQQNTNNKTKSNPGKKALKAQ